VAGGRARDGEERGGAVKRAAAPVRRAGAEQAECVVAEYARYAELVLRQEEALSRDDLGTLAALEGEAEAMRARIAALDAASELLRAHPESRARVEELLGGAWERGQRLERTLSERRTRTADELRTLREGRRRAARYRADPGPAPREARLDVKL